MSIILYLLLLIFIAIDFIKDKKILSPVKIFNAIWLIIYALYSLNLSYIQQPLSERTIIIFIVCIFFYNVSCLLIKKFYPKTKKDKKTRMRLFQKLDIKKRLDIINVAFIIVFIIEIIYSGGVPLLFRLQGKNSQYLNFGITSVHGLLNGIAVCLGAYYLLKKDKRKYIYLIFGILTISRQVLITLIIEAVVFYLCTKINQKINYKKTILGLGGLLFAAIIGFGIIGNFRSGNETMNIVFRPREQYEKLPSGIMWLYSYTEFSLSNFNNLVSMTPGGVNYGTSTLKFFLPSIIVNKLSIKENFNDDYLVASNFNVSTWFPEIYLDFGIIGIAIFSILIGMLGGFLYRKVVEVNNDMYNLLYAVFVHNILLFFFVNFFIYIPMAIQFVLIPILFGGEKNAKELSCKHNYSNI